MDPEPTCWYAIYFKLKVGRNEGEVLFFLIHLYIRYLFISIPIKPVAMASVYIHIYHIWCIDLHECLIFMGR